MAKVTWLGEGLEGEKESWDSKGRVFKKGEAVDIDDQDTSLLETLSRNKHFKVEGYEQQQQPRTWAPPSQQMTPQHPVPKGGEPIPNQVSPHDAREGEPRVEGGEEGDRQQKQWPRI